MPREESAAETPPPAIAGSWRAFLLALGLALIVAEVVGLAFAAGHDVIGVAPVDVHQWFTSAELDRIRAFRRPQLAIYAASLLVQFAVLALLVWRPPRRLPRRPLVAAVAVSLTLTVAGLPLAVVSRIRALDVGLATQSWPAWALDTLKSAAIGAVMAAVVAVLFFALMRWLPRRWWVAGSGLVVLVAVIVVYAWPIVLDPLFNRFEPLPAGPTRSEVLALADRAGVDVGQVYVMDASRRTSAANAYVVGIGHSKRVVLYDNLLRSFDRSELRVVVAHELAHVKHRDVMNGLIYAAIVAPFAVFAVSRLRPRTVPALWLAIVLVATPVTWVSNQLSRSVEARADSDALRSTGEPRAMIDFERRIAISNLTDPDPLKIPQFLLGTHPTTAERIGMALEFERGRATASAAAVRARSSAGSRDDRTRSRAR